jgi:hypothetical protein
MKLIPLVKKTGKILGLLIGAFVILTLVMIIIQISSTGEYYHGSENPITEEWCDYGYHIKDEQCCQDDDYSCEMCTWKDYDCSDFKTQSEALIYYDTCKNFLKNEKDFHNLDRDGDGMVCETLPKK